MTLEAILAGIGAILTAAFGVALVVREFRRRDRKESRAEIEELNDEVHALRADFISYRQWAYELAVSLTSAGIAFPPAPPPVQTIKDAE